MSEAISIALFVRDKSGVEHEYDETLFDPPLKRAA